jgi:hypothetical protein
MLGKMRPTGSESASKYLSTTCLATKLTRQRGGLPADFLIVVTLA